MRLALAAVALAGCSAANPLYLDDSGAPVDLSGADLTGSPSDMTGGPIDLAGIDLTGNPDLSSGGNCAMTCGPFFTCCGDTCVNQQNDPTHCGDCSTVCTGNKPFCSNGTCAAPPCNGQPCNAMALCCGQFCCQPGQLCCDVQGPGPSFGPTCFTPTPQQPTCPKGCPACQ
jgi:hypothetical protein